jgi:2-dehydro-3-deoxygalactonokinase
MAGSNRGWVDAPYLPCPVGIDDLVKNLVWPDERSAIVPGVSYIGQGRADVMRGEEVQLLGGVAAGLVNSEGFVCHPGTHNKWALLRHGTIHIFGTVMTGELFNLLREHSILANLLQAPVEPNDAFKRGVRRAMDREMLGADLFGVRAGVLLGQANEDEASSYASGLLIGADVRIGLTWPAGARIGVIGRPELTRLYAAAIREAGREAIELDGERCFLAGIQEIAKRI